MTLPTETSRRLTNASNIWLATVRPDETPHLVPIWFVSDLERVYLCTVRSSVKVRNLLENPNVALALEDGNNPLILEGRAEILDAIPPQVAEAFQRKYNWDILTDTTYNALIQVTVLRSRS